MFSPKTPPRGVPKGVQKRSKNGKGPKNGNSLTGTERLTPFGPLFGPFLELCLVKKSSKFMTRCQGRKNSVFGTFLERFWSGRNTENRSKVVCVTTFPEGRVFVRQKGLRTAFGPRKGAQNEPKGVPEGEQNWSVFGAEFWSGFGAAPSPNGR